MVEDAAWLDYIEEVTKRKDEIISRAEGEKR